MPDQPESARLPHPESPETRSLNDVVLVTTAAANVANTALALKALKQSKDK